MLGPLVYLKGCMIFWEGRRDYPHEAIQEAVSSAIIHSDYSILVDDINVAIFDDILEITSLGPLPDTIPIEKLATGRSEIRNRPLPYPNFLPSF